MIISRKFSFDSAHHLPGYIGKCANVHGHHWVGELAVDGNIGRDGMVIDFKFLKDWLEKNVVSILDHNDLNSIISNPTAENIAIWIAEAFEDSFTIKLAYIRIWETENSMVEWRPKDE